MELRQLEYFLKCAEKGSLTRAAEELYTTQPHVSQVIRALERELGVSLFRRTGTGIVLTEDGERIRFYAQNAVKNAALIEETARDRSGETLRIAPMTLGFYTGEATGVFNAATQSAVTRLRPAPALPARNRPLSAIRVGKRPLQGTRALVSTASSRSRSLSMMRQPVTPAALQPRPIIMHRLCLPQARQR